MNRVFSSAVAMLLGGVVLAGCQAGPSYPPDATLSSYAAKQNFPSGVTPDPVRGSGLFYDVADNGVLTIFNAGDTAYSNVNIWVNQQFLIHEDAIQPHSRMTIPPEKMYDSSAHNLTTIKPDDIRKVQVTTEANAHVYDLAGPVKMVQN
jgi:hypothetical protein